LEIDQLAHPVFVLECACTSLRSLIRASTKTTTSENKHTISEVIRESFSLVHKHFQENARVLLDSVDEEVDEAFNRARELRLYASGIRSCAA
jgi:uncharacterized protein YktB (UPF0637 family)